MADPADPPADKPAEPAEPTASKPAEPLETTPTKVVEPVETTPSKPAEPLESTPTKVVEPVETTPSKPGEPLETTPTKVVEPVETTVSKSAEPLETTPTKVVEPVETTVSKPHEPLETTPTKVVEPVETTPWLVTGGAGWLGTNLLNHLVAQGREVRALALPSEALAVRARYGSAVDVFDGDVRDQAAVGQWARGAAGATVIHLAGVIHPRKTADWHTINVDGTRNVLEAALAAQASRVVVMSSNSPIGTNPTREHRFDESSPFDPYLGYGRSKQAMEELVNDFHTRFGLATTLVRAPWFYGPHQPPRQTLFFEMVRDGKAPIVGDGGNMRSMSYVDNLVQGIELCATHPAAPGRTFWIADARAYSMNEIVDTVEAMLEEAGIPCAHKRMRLPGFAGPVAYAVDAALQRVGVYQQKIHVLGEMDKNIACSVETARAVIGYDPQIDLEEGMRRSIRWAIEVGHLRVPR